MTSVLGESACCDQNSVSRKSQEAMMGRRGHIRTMGRLGVLSFLIAAVCGSLRFVSAAPPLNAVTVVANAADDVQDLLLLGPLEPTRLRLRIEIDGVPFRTAWRDTFNRQFDQFDTDHDGLLTPEQATQLSAVFGAGAITSGRAASAKAMMMTKTNLTRAQVQEQLEQSAPALKLVQTLSSRGAGPALIPLLDANQDGRLSREELANAAQSLHCRDFNDDQLITEQELVAGPVVVESNSTTETWGNEGSVILILPTMDATAVAELLLRRYDRDRDGMISLRAPAEVQAGESSLAALDTDGDGLLNRAELRGYLDLPQDAELPLVLGSGGSKRKGEAAPRYRLRGNLSGGYRLHVGSREINFRRNNRNPGQDETRIKMADYDADNNGYLDAAEFMMIPDRPEFAVMDSNHDERITANEFDAFFLQRSKALTVQLLLEATEQGSDLFKSLDRNFDRVLTPRELLMAPQLLDTDDQDHDGFLGAAEMSYNLTLELMRGTPRAITNANVTLRAPLQPRVKADRTGPAWFLKMDRNRDGDVGLPEFPGGRFRFMKLDKNGDGLISSDEAKLASTPAK